MELKVRSLGLLSVTVTVQCHLAFSGVSFSNIVSLSDSLLRRGVSMNPAMEMLPYSAETFSSQHRICAACSELCDAGIEITIILISFSANRRSRRNSGRCIEANN